MAMLAELPALRYALSAILIAIALTLQFVPLYERRLNELIPRYPALRIIKYRLFQLPAGFGLLTVAIDMLR